LFCFKRSKSGTFHFSDIQIDSKGLRVDGNSSDSADQQQQQQLQQLQPNSAGGSLTPADANSASSVGSASEEMFSNPRPSPRKSSGPSVR